MSTSRRCRRSPTATLAGAHRCCSRTRAPSSRRSSSALCAATPRRVPRRALCAARELPPSGTWRCRWSRAACWPNGTPRGGRLTVSGGAKVLFFNRRTLAKQMDLPERDRDRRERRRRRLRRARRVLPGGLSHPVRRTLCRPAGEMDRGPARAPDVREPRARGGMRHRDRLRARRPSSACAAMPL